MATSGGRTSTRAGMKLHRFLSICMLGALCLATPAAWAQEAIGIPASEREVLLALYANTNGATWTVRTNWNGPVGSECQWFGVVCNSAGNAVNVVSLPNNNLAGTLPANLNALTHLGIFDGSDNQLTGPIPALTGL